MALSITNFFESVMILFKNYTNSSESTYCNFIIPGEKSFFAVTDSLYRLLNTVFPEEFVKHESIVTVFQINRPERVAVERGAQFADAGD